MVTKLCNDRALKTLLAALLAVLFLATACTSESVKKTDQSIEQNDALIRLKEVYSALLTYEYSYKQLPKTVGNASRFDSIFSPDGVSWRVALLDFIAAIDAGDKSGLKMAIDFHGRDIFTGKGFVIAGTFNRLPSRQLNKLPSDSVLLFLVPNIPQDKWDFNESEFSFNYADTNKSDVTYVLFSDGAIGSIRISEYSKLMNSQTAFDSKESDRKQFCNIIYEPVVHGRVRN